MQRIPLTQVEPGMILAEAVNYPTGMILAGVGVTLSDTMIERIHKLGVATLVIEGDAENNCDELQSVISRLPLLFQRHRNNAFMMTLHNMLRKYFQEKVTQTLAAEAERKAARAAKEAELKAEKEAREAECRAATELEGEKQSSGEPEGGQQG